VGIEAHSFIFPAGEQSKTLATAESIYKWLIERRAERNHAILAVGGGVTGDLGGFVAATFLRGIPFIQVPTSMAAMVDASIGGKVAVNVPEAKNMIGSFYQPKMVLADPETLLTLDNRGLSEGWAEAIKHGFIRDQNLVEIFENNAEALGSLDPDISTAVIRRSIQIKADVVSNDEKEKLGIRILLNYGHTVGHALEVASRYGKYLHGEGVSIGMMAAAEISFKMGMIEKDVVQRQEHILRQFNLPIVARQVDPSTLSQAMQLDKKTEKGSVRWVLLREVGHAVSTRDVPKSVVDEVLSLITGNC
jgi:3-dehydroquinate synthase